MLSGVWVSPPSGVFVELLEERFCKFQAHLCRHFPPSPCLPVIHPGDLAHAVDAPADELYCCGQGVCELPGVCGRVAFQDLLELPGRFVQLNGSGCVVSVWAFGSVFLRWVPGVVLCRWWRWLGWCPAVWSCWCCGAACYVAPSGLKDGLAFV